MVREHKRAQALLFHRLLQALQPLVCQSLHIDAERRKVRVKHQFLPWVVVIPIPSRICQSWPSQALSETDSISKDVRLYSSH